MGSITGQKRFLAIDTTPEAVPGVENSSPTEKCAEVVSGGVTVKETPQYDNQEVEANLDSQPAEQRSHFEPQGGVELYAAPYDSTLGMSWMKFLLDWTFLRTSGVQRAHTVKHYYPIGTPDSFGRRFTGCKVDTFSIAWGRDNRMKNPSISIRGMFPDRIADGDVPTSPVFPTSRAWNFTYMGCQIGNSAWSGYTGPATIEKLLRELTIENKNSLEAGAIGRRYDSSNNIVLGLDSVDEGTPELTGSFDIQLQNGTDWYQKFLDAGGGSIRILGFHSDSIRTSINNVGGYSTTNTDDGGSSTLAMVVSDSTGFEAGTVVYIEDTTDPDPANWLREVLYVISVDSGTDTLTLDLDGAVNAESIGRNQAFSNGSKVFNTGIQLLVRDFSITDWDVDGGAKDKLYEKVPWKASQYQGDHPTEGSNYLYPALGYLVR